MYASVPEEAFVTLNLNTRDTPVVPDWPPMNVHPLEAVHTVGSIAEKNTVSPRVLKKVIESATQSIAASSEEPAMPVEESMGLMARKKKEGEQ